MHIRTIPVRTKRGVIQATPGNLLVDPAGGNPEPHAVMSAFNLNATSCKRNYLRRIHALLTKIYGGLTYSYWTTLPPDYEIDISDML